MASAEYLLARRNDLTSFVVHLTRNLGPLRGAKSNLMSILKSKSIKAVNSHCLFASKLKVGVADAAVRESFFTACFSETPLSEINYVTHPMEGRSIEMSQYGLVFTKATIQKHGGNPVIYIDTRSQSGKRRQSALWKCFDVAVKTPDHQYRAFLPLVNKASDDYDFCWEREWRIIGGFSFDLDDVFLGLAPRDQISEFEKKFPQFPWISPRWGRDQIIEKLQAKYTALANQEEE